MTGDVYDSSTKGSLWGEGEALRPISGRVVNKFGHRGLSYAGIPLQSTILMLIPLFTGFGPILVVYVSSGLMRAIAIVANCLRIGAGRS